MNEHEYEGETYNDDRMFVLYTCKCTVSEKDDLIVTTIYHAELPGHYKWCVVTYRNVARYRVYKVDHFNTEDEAREYSALIEPQTPLISLGGKSPITPPTYNEFVNWKENNSLSEYDYKQMFPPHLSNPTENIYQKKP